MALNIAEIKKLLSTTYQRIRKNILSLGDDSTLESDLKPLKIGDKVSPLEISETELNVRGTINAEAINVGGSTVFTKLNWHGYDRIKFFPHQFVEDEGTAGRQHALVEDDVTGKLGLRVSNTSAILYTWINIPKDYSATAVRCYADTGVSISVQCYSTDIDDGDITDIGVGVANVEIDITNVDSTETNSIIVRLTYANTTTEFYGGYITIEPIS